MTRSDLQRLRDAKAYAWHAQTNAGGLPPDVLAAASQPLHAALFGLVVVGESLNKVSAAVKSAAPDIPWQPANELRNFIVHAYWQIDLNIIADVIENRLEPLIAQIDALIAVVEKSDSRS